MDKLPEAASQLITHIQSQPSIIYASAFDDEVITDEIVESNAQER